MHWLVCGDWSHGLARARYSGCAIESDNYVCGVVRMIEIILTCDVCGVQSDFIKARSVDRYSWHDAPYDSVQVDEPMTWAVDYDNLIARCPDHQRISA